MKLPTVPSLLLACLGGAGLLSACTTVGTDYAGPPVTPQAAGFARAGTPDMPATPADSKALAHWWTELGDPLLDQLVDRALQANPNLALASARVRQARASLRSEQANGKPKGSATALAAHAHLPTLGSGSGNDSGGDGGNNDSLSIPSSLNLYSVGFDASWEIDLFGGQRRATEAAGAAAEAAEARLADAQLSLVAEVAQAYVNLRSTQAQVALSNAAIERQQRSLELALRRVKAGTASELDITRLQGQLETTRSQAEPLGAQLDAYRDELAMLVGVAPGALDAELGADPANAAAVPLPPASVAVGDPTAMLRRRPDIRAAERTLAQRQAQIGQAQAARFPKLSLMGLIGIGGTHVSDLTHLDDYSAIIAPQLSWNVLDFGRVNANIEQSQGVRDEAEAQYRIAVLGALRDAEDALSRFRQRRTSVATIARAKATADRAAVLTAARQRAGTASLIDVLDTERQQLTAEQNLAQAQAALTNDFIALQKALGLGWRGS
ncbi:efflux transporter outer membrane subunit [Pseudoduganella sp. FT25W]|uniref:Efflux transporter outer membrane subunit n=2 Tax=Duganella TaxID=75654 RepID=A0A6L5QEW3_9BURK|nr:efflux transporter outer membrane subunit [Duganella alba]MRX08297.1 efflux transporter outer membrane subunit [Duganella alba]MRX16836.1 efflux transporter outer membrane subunit [Duganella alba]